MADKVVLVDTSILDIAVAINANLKRKRKQKIRELPSVSKKLDLKRTNKPVAKKS